MVNSMMGLRFYYNICKSSFPLNEREREVKHTFSTSCTCEYEFSIVTADAAHNIILYNIHEYTKTR